MIKFCEETIKELDSLTGNEYAEKYVFKKFEFYNKFQKGLINSSFHGLDFFSNVIKYYNNPDSYRLNFSKECFIDKNTSNKLESIYDENFITIIKNNKK